MMKMHKIGFDLELFTRTIVFAGFSLVFLPRLALLDWHMAWQLFIVCALLFAGTYLLGWQYGGQKIAHISAYLGRIFASGMLLALCLGYFHSAALHLIQTAENITALPTKMKIDFRIEEVLQQQAYQSLVVKARLQADLPAQRIYLNWALPAKARMGEIWQGELQLRPLSARYNFGGFDRLQWYLAKGISAYGSVKSAVKIKDDFHWREQRLNAAWQQTQDLPMQGLLLALGFGERAWLSRDIWQPYQQTNTAHLIAISGLHIGLAMWVGWILARAVQGIFPTHLISPSFPLICGLFVSLGYAQLAGLSVPTFRAVLALTVLCVFQFFRAYCTPWQFLWRVVALLLLYDPLMPLSSSFWLSVGAVACLITWYQWVPLRLLMWRGQPLFQAVSRLFRPILSIVHLQLGLLWLFTPIQLFLFHTFFPMGLLANLLAVPFFSFILVPLVLFALITQGAWQSWWWADNMAQWITEILRYLAVGELWISRKNALILTALFALCFVCYVTYLKRLQVKAALEVSNLNAPRFPLSLNWRAIPAKPALQVAQRLALGLSIGCFGVWSYSKMSEPLWRLESLDVGQGLAMLLVKNDRGILYDTGSAWQGGSMARLEILPYLQRQGIQLEQLILSHDDNDHAGGVNDILAVYPDIEVIRPSFKNVGEKYRTLCKQGLRWEWQGLHFSALAPQKNIARADNGHSCVLLVADETYRILLTGDADLALENTFVPLLDKIDVLQVGHHGSRTSTGKALVQTAHPDIALISASRWNAWGFPHAEVLNRLKENAVTVYNTALSGQIRIEFTQGHMRVKTARNPWVPWYEQMIGEE